LKKTSHTRLNSNPSVKVKGDTGESLYNSEGERQTTGPLTKGESQFKKNTAHQTKENAETPNEVQ